jgi:hypothetical protein
MEGPEMGQQRESPAKQGLSGLPEKDSNLH